MAAHGALKRGEHPLPGAASRTVNDDNGEGFQMPAGGVERQGVGWRMETAHARTRGDV